MEQHSNFKVVLIGDSGVGKTSLVNGFQGLAFNQKHVKTLGVQVEPIRVGRRYQHVVFNMWDCAGDPKFAGLDTQYYVNADAFLVCFDLTSNVTLEHCEHWIGKIKTAKLEKKLIILVGLKRDMSGITLTHEKVNQMHPNVWYHEVSTKNSKGLQELLSFLQAKLQGNEAHNAKL